MAQREPHPHPAAYFLEHPCAPLAFTEFSLKQTHSHSKAAPEVADTSISCHTVLGSLPRAQSTSTYQILAAGLGVMLASRFRAFPRTSLRVENVGATALRAPGTTAWPQMCAGLPANAALTRVWVPSFLPSSRNPSDFTFAQTSKATRATPGFASKPGSATAFAAGSWERLVKLLKLLANLNLGLQ